MKLRAADAQKIQAHSAIPPEQLEDAFLQSEMRGLVIHPQPFTLEDQPALEMPIAAPPAAAARPASAPPSAAAPTPRPAEAPPSVEARLDEYDPMRDEGLISADDYETTKKQLLGLWSALASARARAASFRLPAVRPRTRSSPRLVSTALAANV